MHVPSSFTSKFVPTSSPLNFLGLLKITTSKDCTFLS
jgi:hypothetical protein